MEIPVTLGQLLGNLIEIKQDLKEGDKVIGKIHEKIDDGLKVSVKSK